MSTTPIGHNVPRPILALWVSLSVIACDTPTGADDVAGTGTYALISINGAPPPLNTGRTDGTPGCTRFIDRGSLVLSVTPSTQSAQASQDYTLFLAFRGICEGKDFTTVVENNVGGAGSWTMAGSALRLTPLGEGLKAFDISSAKLVEGTVEIRMVADWVGKTPPLTLVLRK